MSKYLIGILICVAFAFNLNGIKGETLLKSRTEVSVSEQNTNYADRDVIATGYEGGVRNDDFLFNTFSNPIICDTLASVLSLPRGMSFPKNLKFTPTIQILSALKTSLATENFRNLNLHSCFVKSSRRYFVYALRRLLI